MEGEEGNETDASVSMGSVGYGGGGEEGKVSTSSQPPPSSSSSSSSSGPSLAALGPQPSLQGETMNLVLLLTLYFLQGIPIGLASSIPMLLQSKGASFGDQALFTLSSWPYSLKWAWAPVVDALHTSSWGLGRRKSWVVPCQLATGVVMVVLASRMDSLLPEGGLPNVPGLLAAFLCLYFLVATQDIAVDGWALTLLRPENVGYASTANTVGQGVGIQVAFSLLLNLDSVDVCNTYIRPALGLPPQTHGILSLGGFLWAWGVVFILVTLAVWALQKEGEEGGGGGGYAPVPTKVEGGEGEEREGEEEVKGGASSSSSSSSPNRSNLRLRAKSNSRCGSEEGRGLEERERESASAGEAGGAADTPTSSPPSPPLSPLASVYSSYVEFFKVCLLPNVILLALVLFTFKAGFSAVDSTTSFVLQNRGVPKETLAFIDTISFPLQLFIQVFFLAQLTARPDALSLFLWAFPIRALSGLLQMATVYWIPNHALDPYTTSTMPLSYVSLLFLVTNAHAVVQSVHFMSLMSFFSRVAAQSPTNGATIMTLLNALTNLGSMWPRPLILLALQALSEKACMKDGSVVAWGGAGVACGDAVATQGCKDAGGMCSTIKDGYPLLVSLGVVYCAVWWVLMKGRVDKLHNAPASGWTLSK